MSRLLVLLALLGASSIAQAVPSLNILSALGKQSIAKQGSGPKGELCTVMMCMERGRAVTVDGVQGRYIGGDPCGETRVMGRKISVSLLNTDVIKESAEQTILTYDAPAEQQNQNVNAANSELIKGALWIETATVTDKAEALINAIKFQFIDLETSRIFSCTIPAE